MRYNIIYGYMRGAASVDAAIKAECQLGSLGLPLNVKCTFPRDVKGLSKSSVHIRKCWLQLVRASCELINDKRISNAFSDQKSYLRR